MTVKTQQPSGFGPPGARGHTPGSSREWEWHGVESTAQCVDRDLRAQEASSSDEGSGAMQVVSAVLGGALLALGLKRRSIGGVALAIAGGGLLFRSTRERTQAPHKVGILSRSIRRRRSSGSLGAMTVLQRSITIQKPAQELYRAWRAAPTLSLIMGHFADVTDVGSHLQHWKLRGPVGMSLEWDSSIVEEHPGEYLRWEATEDSQLPNAGWVRFRPAPEDWGTVVTLKMEFSPPGGPLGSAVVKLLGDAPSAFAHRALRRFKSLMETGELPTTGPNPAARDGGHSY
ncbi:SRPBCC family protein [Pyxidicoccus xibeiensis]|uniref:SRPBCC family protein n=1 Tax=Pyxidicoccus xibeiensis TaxID=2906759 RepID=UPI0020A7EC00|nr:SRPBCC family protein [Pyxidicoccus xibeiensis]MCP3136696.1 SRPBCC family protein [Pyxidicoccus xibeiensis]